MWTTGTTTHPYRFMERSKRDVLPHNQQTLLESLTSDFEIYANLSLSLQGFVGGTYRVFDSFPDEGARLECLSNPQHIEDSFWNTPSLDNTHAHSQECPGQS
eukprot:4468428-Amphidinium_carterae.1